MPILLDLGKSINENQSIQCFPTFFVDSDVEEKDQSSCDEINKLLVWVHQLKPLNVEKINKADPEIKERIEEKDQRTTSKVEGNVIHIKTEYLKRYKEIHYNGKVTYTDWEKYWEKYDEKT